MARIIRLADALSILQDAYNTDEEVFIGLEEDAPANPATEWAFALSDGSTGRIDGKFYSFGPDTDLGYFSMIIEEEPSVPAPENSPKLVGQVIIEINPRGLVHTRTVNGLNGPDIELFSSSLSKGEVDDNQPVNEEQLFGANLKRIKGVIQPLLVEVEFPDEEGMAPAAFAAESHDGRSLSALAKLGLLS